MRDKIKIGLVGFFGWGNFGDELFVKVYEKWLGNKYELRVLNDLTKKPYFSKPVEDVVDDVDAIIIGGGDLIIPWQMSGLYWRKEYLNKPVFIVGIGVPTWGGSKPDVIAQYKDFLMHENLRFFNLRDRESANWVTSNIDLNIDVSYSADIVFALPMPKKLECEDKCLGIVTRYRRNSRDDLTHVKLLAEKAKVEGFKIKHIILGTGDVGERDLQISNDLDVGGKELIYSSSLDELCQQISSCTILASMKFHGTVVATSYGIPSVVLSATDKSRNLMRMLQRRELLSSLKDVNLPDRLNKYVPAIPWASVRMLQQRARRTMEELIREIDIYCG